MRVAGYVFCHNVFPFHSNTILLDLLKFRQLNEGLQRQFWQEDVNIPRLGPEELLWNLNARSKAFFFSSYKKEAEEQLGPWPYHPECD